MDKITKTAVLTGIFFVFIAISIMPDNVFAKEETSGESEFTVPEEQLTAENYLDMHSYKILQLNSTIQGLGDDEFTHPTSRETLKTKISEINDLIKQGGFYTAYHKLLAVKEQMDGSIGGNPNDDEIKEASQGKVLPIVDEKLATIVLASTPSTPEKRGSPDDTKSIIVLYGPYIVGAILLMISIGVIAYLSDIRVRKSLQIPSIMNLAKLINQENMKKTNSEDDQSQMKK